MDVTSSERRPGYTMPMTLQSLQQTAREAYLAHRLNQPELIDVAAKLQAAEKNKGSLDDVKALMDSYVEITTDWRGKTEGTLADATRYLGLDKQYAALSEDKAWTAYDRALYRRMSVPQNDPAPGASAAEASKGNPELVKAALSIFDACDTDHNGNLTPVELDAAMANNNFSNEQIAALVALRRNGPQLETCVKDGKLSKEDLLFFQDHGIPNDSKITNKLNVGYGGLLQRVNKMQPAGPLMEENFDGKEVFQGKAGSCVMLSTEANVPDLKSMFSDNGNGTFTVTFKDGAKEVVKDLSTAERLYHARSGAQGRWPGLMEMAMGQRLNKLSPSPDGSPRSSANGQPVEQTILAFSGIPGKRYTIDKRSPEETRELLTKLTTSASGPLVACTRSTPKGDDSIVSMEALNNGISNNHAYSLLGYNPVTDEVQLRNPWHRGEWTIKQDGVDDGIFSMPLLQFYSSYRMVAAPDLDAAKAA